MPITTLSYGYKLPADGDLGSVFFPAMEDNITRLNSHDHDGTDSALITAGNISKGTVSAASGSWGAAISTGVYRQLLTVPSGFNFDNHTPSARITSTGHIVYPTFEKVTTTTFYVYTSDNSVGYTIIFR